MAQVTLVESQIQDGKRLLDRLAMEGVPATSAAWVKESESGQWYLYVATSLVSEDEATKPAYRRINAVVRELRKEGFAIDPFEIKVIGPHDPICLDLLAVRSEPGRSPIRFQGYHLGELPVDDALVYR